MLCPVCNVELVMSERSGVEIDYCPKCRGVWLDRGELDKILERSSQQATQKPQYDERMRYDDRSGYNYHKPKKRESFLGELFDF